MTSHVLQKGGSGEQEFSDVAKYSYEELTDKENPPEGVDMQRKEVPVPEFKYPSSGNRMQVPAYR